MSEDHDGHDHPEEVIQEVERRMTAAVTTTDPKKAVIKKGNLAKLGGLVFKNWQNRHFVLSPDSLAYYDKEGSSVIKGGILMENISDVREASASEGRNRTSCFIITTKQDKKSRNFVISAENDDLRNEWMEAINGRVAKATEKAATSEAAAAVDAKPIVVLGATGMVGSATVTELSLKGAAVRAGVRNPEKANKLGELQNVTVIAADMNKPDTLSAAFEGVSSAFIVTPGAENRAELVVGAVEAAKAAGVPHMVVVSVPSVNSDADGIFKEQFLKIEEAVKSSGIPYVLLQLPMFIENQWGNQATIQSQAKLYCPVDPTKQISLIAIADIGAAAATILSTPADHNNKIYYLASEKISFNEITATFSKLSGTTVEYVRVPNDAAVQAMTGNGVPKWMADGISELFDLMNAEDASQTGETSDLTEILGRAPLTFEEWLSPIIDAFKPANNVEDYNPASIADAWKNHFDAFGAQDLDKIMLDYSDETVITFIDWATMKEAVQHKGTEAIKLFFENLFKMLSDLSDLEAPTVIVEEGPAPMVCLNWKNPASGILSAHDSFFFDGDSKKILRQNIAATTKVEK